MSLSLLTVQYLETFATNLWTNLMPYEIREAVADNPLALLAFSVSPKGPHRRPDQPLCDAASLQTTQPACCQRRASQWPAESGVPNVVSLVVPQNAKTAAAAQV